MKREKTSQERAKVLASAGKGNGEVRTVTIQGSTHTFLHFIFFLSIPHLPAPFPVGTIIGKPNTFSQGPKDGQHHQHGIQHKLFCSKNILSGVVSNSSSVDSPYHRILLILNNDIASKWDSADPQKKEPLMVMKYLDTPILQCEIQELPEPDTATIFRKSPTSCLLRSYPLPRAVCS